MSKKSIHCLTVSTVFLVILQLFTSAFGQRVELSIRVNDKAKNDTQVSGRISGDDPRRNRRSIGHRTAIAGRSIDPDRYSMMELFDPEGGAVGYRSIAPGEFLAERDVLGWRFLADLSPGQTGQSPNVSWLDNGIGILMPADLLPTGLSGNRTRGSVSLGLPKGWAVKTVEREVGDLRFEAEDLEGAVFAVGDKWREIGVANANAGRVLIEGEWLFSDAEASAMAGEVFAEHKKVMGPLAEEQFVVLLSRLRGGTRHGQWEAETRGRTIVIVSGDMAFRTQSVQRLHEQFRHELFHLWIPNGASLTGPYDWFYEGFALYRSLKLAVGLKRIRFEDMLETLTQANAIAVRGHAISLIDASKQRRVGSDLGLYARGMIFAFLCDVEMLNSSGGRRSIEDILKQLYARHKKPAAALDGNEAVLNLLGERPELRALVSSHVTGSNLMDWSSQLKLTGLKPSGTGGRLMPEERLTSRQRTILRGLGYNRR